MEDYYIDEIGAVVSAWNGLHNPDGEREPERVGAQDFLGGGGEML